MHREIVELFTNKYGDLGKRWRYNGTDKHYQYLGIHREAVELITNSYGA
jgi:hypothetical protein